MLLGGGGGGVGDGPNANMAAVSDPGAAAASLALTSSSVAASTTTSNYANSMWGASSGSQTSSQGREKVIVDGNDLEEWPSIAGNEGGGGASFTVAVGGGASSNNNNNVMPVNSISASGNQSSPTSSFSLPNECMQSSNGVAWGTAASPGHLSGGGAVAAAGSPLPPPTPSSLSKASAVPGSHEASGPVDGSSSSGIPGANFNPNANPSAWPALVQQEGEGAPSSFHHQGPAGSLSANNPPSLGLGGGAVGVLGGHPPLSVNQSSTHQRQLHQMQSRDREMGGGKWDSESAGPKIAGGGGELGEEWTVEEARVGETMASPPPGEASLLTLQLTPKRVTQGLTDGRGAELVDSELLKEITGPRVGGIRVPLVGRVLGVVLGTAAKPPGYLREGGGHREVEVEIGEGAPLLPLVELLQQARLSVESAAVTAAAVGAAQLETPLHPLPPPPLPQQQQPPPLRLELGTIRKGRVKQGSGEVGDREHREGPPLVAEIPEVGTGEVTVVLLSTLHLTLKLPYRPCSAGPTWIPGSCPTRDGAKHRSDKTRPGTLRSMEGRVKVDRRQLQRSTPPLLPVVPLSTRVDPGLKSMNLLGVRGSILPWVPPQGPQEERAGRAAATVAVVGHLSLGEPHHRLQATT
ncbi:hypothetical protein CesoFtcFv8_021753 [Champsocephalus esox]|uniref:Uncharacterized protein n=1 Tax=Champsocephalus esox TaxID=159716 RepID=A0AAN8BA43_9TELE|nr:hypothetical protein CesoFtcFv8_021753 [Champsocephalus esox]